VVCGKRTPQAVNRDPVRDRFTAVTFDTYIGAYVISACMRIPATRKVRLPRAVGERRSSEDLIAAYGSAGVGARLRRLSERIDREARAVYKHAGIDFEQRWVGVLILLIERRALTVGELAEALGITQPSVSQTLRSLQAAKLVLARTDPRDPRRRIQALTEAGLQLVEKARPVWEALMEAARDLDRAGIDIVTPLAQIERELDRKSILERALGYLNRAPARQDRRA
jgi:MarR family transcriptional regulator, organic hydroperoxide resistance regulator